MPKDEWKKKKPVKRDRGNPKIKCPRCGSNMTIRKKDNSIFYGCTEFPACRGTRSYEERVSPIGEPQPEAGLFLVTEKWLKETSKGQVGWSAAQLDVLGVSWPPPFNWKDKLLGSKITWAQKREFESLRRDGATLHCAPKRTQAVFVNVVLMNDNIGKGYLPLRRPGGA